MVKVLMRVIDGYTMEDAVNVMQVWWKDRLDSLDVGRADALALQCAAVQDKWERFAWVSGHALSHCILLRPTLSQEAHMNGLALVTACAQETAEEYCEQLRGAGLIASLEPDGGGGGSS